MEQNDGYVNRKEECKVPMLVSSAPNQVHFKVFLILKVPLSLTFNSDRLGPHFVISQPYKFISCHYVMMPLGLLLEFATLEDFDHVSLIFTFQKASKYWTKTNENNGKILK